MAKVVTILTFLLLMLNLVPPLFREGAIFDLWDSVQVSCDGSEIVVSGLYFDNVYYTLLYLILTYTAICIPYLVENLPRVIRWLSFGVGSWFMFGLMFEVMNFFVPDLILNTHTSDYNYSKAVLVSTLFISFILLHQSWTQRKA